MTNGGVPDKGTCRVIASRLGLLLVLPGDNIPFWDPRDPGGVLSFPSGSSVPRREW